jgi:hypothetical protein
MRFCIKLLSVGLFLASICLARPFATGSVTGKVETENGKGMSGAAITATSKSGTETKATTGSDGKFSLSLDDGEYTLLISFSGYSSVSIPITVSGKKIEIKTVRMAKQISVSKIRGKVYTEDGIAIPGATLTLERTDAGKSLKLIRQTNSSGEFAFQLPGESGHYRVTASMKGFKSETKDTDVDADEVRSMAFKLGK